MTVMLLAAIIGPRLWFGHVMRRHSAERPDFPGTGGELARHLLDNAGLADVPVEVTDRGDHYDPGARAVRLSAAHHNGRSLTAVAVAAHEVGHALQDRDGYAPLSARTDWVRLLLPIQRVGSLFFALSPFGGVFGGPGVLVVSLITAFVCMALPVFVHLMTLPVEYDASYGRALPILAMGGYVPAEDMPAVRQVLGAAALTYLAASLISMINLGRWLTILLRR